jgi:3-deoxy-7-phosphoheptulonate synthase
MSGVEKMIPLVSGNGLHDRENTAGSSSITIAGVNIGEGDVAVIAGPCAVESLEQAVRIGESVYSAGARIFRGGAFKPRTSPYSFQGLGKEGLEILATVRRETGLLIATEALGVENLEDVYRVADIIQVGSRNMQNTPLLKEVGKLDKPVILKRGMAATLEEWLMAAEYILSEGNTRVILCERGIRTFLDHSRFTLDLGVIPAVRERTNLPIIVDPSHGTGKRSHVVSMALAALAAGADGVMVEVHNSPDDSISDASQSIRTTTFAAMMESLGRLLPVLHPAE